MCKLNVIYVLCVCYGLLTEQLKFQPLDRKEVVSDHSRKLTGIRSKTLPHKTHIDYKYHHGYSPMLTICTLYKTLNSLLTGFKLAF